MANIKEEFLNRVLKLSEKELARVYPEAFKEDRAEATKEMMRKAAGDMYDEAARNVATTIESALRSDKYKQDIAGYSSDTANKIDTANNVVAATARQKVNAMSLEQAVVVTAKEAAHAEAKRRMLGVNLKDPKKLAESERLEIIAKTEHAMIRDIRNNYKIKVEVESKAAEIKAATPEPTQPAPVEEINKRHSIFRRFSKSLTASQTGTPNASPTSSPAQSPVMPRKTGGGTQNDLLKQALNKSSASAERSSQSVPPDAASKPAGNTQMFDDILDLLDKNDDHTSEDELISPAEEDLYEVYTHNESNYVNAEPPKITKPLPKTPPSATATPTQSRRSISEKSTDNAASQAPTSTTNISASESKSSPIVPPRKNTESPIPPPKSATATPTLSRRSISEKPPSKSVPQPPDSTAKISATEGKSSPVVPPRKNTESPTPPPKSGTATPQRQSGTVQNAGTNADTASPKSERPRGSGVVSSLMNPELRKKLEMAVQNSKGALADRTSVMEVGKK